MSSREDLPAYLTDRPTGQSLSAIIAVDAMLALFAFVSIALFLPAECANAPTACIYRNISAFQPALV